MFFGLDAEKLFILVVIAAFVIGPQKLPGLAQQAARFVVRAREWADEAKSKAKEELGDDFDDLELRSLDPRQYDPRRIIREALISDASVPPVGGDEHHRAVPGSTRPDEGGHPASSLIEAGVRGPAPPVASATAGGESDQVGENLPTRPTENVA